MGLIPTFTPADIRKKLDEAIARIDKAILFRLRYLGEQCVNKARDLNTYRDQTGNLRSSIGYVIVRNGTVIRSNFQRNRTQQPGEGRRKAGYGKSGLMEGEKLANSLVSEFPDGYALIVVAGMNYAAKVESTGKDVLTSAEQYAEAELPRLLRELANDITLIR